MGSVVSLMRKPVRLLLDDSARSLEDLLVGCCCEAGATKVAEREAEVGWDCSRKSPVELE